MIILKSPEEIGEIRRAGGIVARAIDAILEEVRPGVTTARLDAVAERVITGEGAIPSFKGYRGYPASLCASLNEQVVHGIPGRRMLLDGDVLSLDLGAVWDGYHGDAAVTVLVGTPSSPEAERLVRATKDALDAGIERMRAAGRLSDIGNAIQRVAEGAGFSVVREYVGHGIGRALHEDPQVHNFGPSGRGPALKPGLVLAVEPMVNAGGWETAVLPDGWTVVTADGSLSAHFEHTVAITEDGPEILTART